MICPKCGTENGNSSMKCVKCWRPLQPVEKGPWLDSKGKPPRQAPVKQSPPSAVNVLIAVLLAIGTLLYLFAPSVIERIHEYVDEALIGKSKREAVRPAPGPAEGKAARSQGPGAASPTVIPSLGAKVTALYFFESGYQPAVMGQRAYADRFPGERSRYINWELRLTHPQREKRTDFRIDEVWYKPDGSTLARQSLRTHLQKTWVRSYHHHGWGWDQPSRWPPGSYRVELSVDGAKIASGLFTVTRAPTLSQ